MGGGERASSDGGTCRALASANWSHAPAQSQEERALAEAYVAWEGAHTGTTGERRGGSEPPLLSLAGVAPTFHRVWKGVTESHAHDGAR